MAEYELNSTLNELVQYTLNSELREQEEYTINTILDFKPSKTSELINDSGFITSSYVGNGALTIQKNGVTIGTFTANQNTNQTVNIEADTQVNADWTATSGVAEILHKPDLTIYATNTALSEGLATKQNTISDLSDIRIGAGKGATALQPNDNITQLTNNAGYITKSVNNLDNYMLTSNINTALGGKVNTTDIINNVTTTTTNQALSANMGKELQDQITNLKQRGRYLSIWNCTTGLATTEPTVNPYTYKAGDYFIIGVVGTTNYKPNGLTYDKDVASTTIETGDVQVNDTYYFDGTSWSLLHTQQPTVAFGTLAGSPYDNANLTTALNAKVSSNNAITSATKCKITYDSKGLVTSGANLENSDITTALGYTPENVSYKRFTISSTSTNMEYPSALAVYNYHDNTKQNVINNSNKLSSDLVTDSEHTNKFVTSSDKSKISTLNLYYMNTGENIDLATVDNSSEGATYGFSYGTVSGHTGLCSNNTGVDSSYSYAKISFYTGDDTNITVSFYQSSEQGYDFGVISNIDEELPNDDTYTGSEYWNGSSVSEISSSITYSNVEAGEHFFTCKYIKDVSAETPPDLFVITGITLNSTKSILEYDTQINIGVEFTDNKVTSISSSSTDTQYPSAKCVYDIVGDIEEALQTIRGV